MKTYEETINIVKNEIELEKQEMIQRKMIQLSKIQDIEAIKVLYLMIKEQELICRNGRYFLLTQLDYQDNFDQTNISINLANNTVKQAYRLLDWIITSFYINPNIQDNRHSTVYGYLMANLLGIYKSNNNFHSRYDLEKIMVKISKKIASSYNININSICYKNAEGKQKNYVKLVNQYHEKNAYFLDKKHQSGTMNEILYSLSTEPKEIENHLIENTEIRDIYSYNNVERFTEAKRYTKRTLEFTTHFFERQ